MIMTVKDIAEYLRVTPLTIYRMVWAGKLPHFRLNRGNGRLRFRLGDIEGMFEI